MSSNPKTATPATAPTTPPITCFCCGDKLTPPPLPESASELVVGLDPATVKVPTLSSPGLVVVEVGEVL